MSLIEEMMTECAFIDKTKVPDGEGGFVNGWTEGAHFQGAIVIENSTLAIVAESQQLARTYRITVSKNIPLDKGDVIKRISDGATFKITSDGTDVKSPTGSALDISQVTAERWDLAL